MTKHVTWFPAQGGGRGGTPDFKWQGWSNGGKNKTPQEIPSASNKTPPKSLNQNSTPKNSHAEFPRHKNFQKRPEYVNYHESSDCFEYPKISYTHQVAPKILAKIFLSKRNPEIENFKPKKILRSSLSLEIWSTPPPPFPAYIIFINGRSLTWYQTFTKKEHYIILTRSRNTEMNPLFRTSGNKAFFVNVIHKDSSRQCYYKTSTTEEPSLFTNLTVTPL